MPVKYAEKNPVRCSSSHLDYRPNGRAHRHQHHEILIIIKGSGTHVIDYVTYPVQDGQIFFLRPGQVHQFMPDTGSIFHFVAIDKESILLKSGVYINGFEFFQSFNTQAFILLSDLSEILKTITVLETETKRNDRPYNQAILISGYLMVFLVQIQRAFLDRNTAPASDRSELVERFNQLIDDPEVCDRFVQNYAKRLHVSANYLNECVKRETLRPASNWIQEKTLIEAKRLLRLTDVGIGEIGLQLGFKEMTHFTRFFKTKTNMTPVQFRKAV